MAATSKNFDIGIKEYASEIKHILGKDCEKVVLYGSYVRGEYGEDSDIDLVIFTSRGPNDFSSLFDEISEATFEYSVKYDMILSPVFENTREFYRMLKALPYYQNIEKEGIPIG